jgi:hypothetical protein
MANRMPIKQPYEELDYDFNFVDLLATGETIASSTVTIVPNDATMVLGTKVNTTTAVKQWVSAGTSGVTYTLTCRIVTSNSPARKYEREMTIPVEEV